MNNEYGQRHDTDFIAPSTDAVDASHPSNLKSSIEASESREKIEQELIGSVLQTGGTLASLSLPRGYSRDGNVPGFQDSYDSKRMGYEKERNLSTRSGYSSEKFKTHEAEFEQQGIHEAVAFEPLQSGDWEEESVTVQKKSFFGTKTSVEKRPVYKVRVARINEFVVGADPNQAAFVMHYRTFDPRTQSRYKDYSHRSGQFLMLQIILPESEARKLAEEIKANPKFLRKLVKAVMLNRHAIQENDWDNGSEVTEGVPLSPPYDAWKEDGKGKEPVYLEIDGKSLVV